MGLLSFRKFTYLFIFGLLAVLPFFALAQSQTGSSSNTPSVGNGASSGNSSQTGNNVGQTNATGSQSGNQLSGQGIVIPSGTGLPEGTVKSVLSRVLNWLLMIFIVIATISFVVTGLQFIFSFGGSTGAETQAKKNFVYTIIAIFIVGGALIILNAILYLLGNGGTGTARNNNPAQNGSIQQDSPSGNATSSTGSNQPSSSGGINGNTGGGSGSGSGGASGPTPPATNGPTYPPNTNGPWWL